MCNTLSDTSLLTDIGQKYIDFYNQTVHLKHSQIEKLADQLFSFPLKVNLAEPITVQTAKDYARGLSKLAKYVGPWSNPQANFYPSKSTSTVTIHHHCIAKETKTVALTLLKINSQGRIEEIEDVCSDETEDMQLLFEEEISKSHALDAELISHGEEFLHSIAKIPSSFSSCLFRKKLPHFTPDYFVNGKQIYPPDHYGELYNQIGSWKVLETALYPSSKTQTVTIRYEIISEKIHFKVIALLKLDTFGISRIDEVNNW